MTGILFLCLLLTSAQASLKVYVSFSMPEESLKKLYTDVNKVGGQLLMRGLLKNSFQKTIQKLHQLEIVVQIDPQRFKENQITVVPTFILEEKGQKDQISGHLSLLYVLGTFSKSGHTHQEASNLLAQLKAQPIKEHP